MTPLQPDQWMAFEEFAAREPIYTPEPSTSPTTPLPSAPKLTPVPLDGKEPGNILRPATFNDIVGQARVKRQLQRMVASSEARNVPLDHVLFVGPSGTGKTTLAHVIARALGVQVFQLEAPVSHDTLVELASAMSDRDILFLDEIHQQAVQERRGRSSSTQPEVLFSIMEDRTLPTGHGVMRFPEITLIGATTDEGMLPDAFVNRFPVRPRLERYGTDDLLRIARANVEAMHLTADNRALSIFAGASRGVPREINNFVRNAASLSEGGLLTRRLALEVLDFNGVSEDGLTADMQEMMRYLLRCPRHTVATGEVRYQASVNSVATAIGKSRDVKAVQLRVEPHLIERGYVQVAHGGRILTDAGIARARELESQ